MKTKNIAFVFLISLLLILPILNLVTQNTLNCGKISNNQNGITLNTNIWKINGTAVCSADKDQIAIQICPDGADGAYLVWQDFRNGNYDIYAQRIDKNGVPQWTANGVAVCTIGWDQYAPQLCRDGAGGLVVTWQDYRNAGNPTIYAQRLNTAGAPQWTINGIAVANKSNVIGYPVLTAYNGYSIIAWSDRREGVDYQIYAQCLSSSGVRQWQANGTAVCNATGDQTNPKICTDENYGAFISWRDDRNVGYSADIYAQHILQNGTTTWTANGTAICGATGSQLYHQMVEGYYSVDHADGTVITWEDYRNGDADIYAQWINYAGVIQWAGNGTPVCNAENGQTSPQICYSVPGSIIITWQDARNGLTSHIYAQRYLFFGGVQWALNGTAICTADNSQGATRICSADNGGAFITWIDTRSGSGYDLYIQKVNATGVPQWTSNGTLVNSANGGTMTVVEVTSSGNGHEALTAWVDNRNSTNKDIYAKRLDAAPPMSFSIASPTTWVNTQVPPVICKFYLPVSSWETGVDVSSVQYAYSNTGATEPTNWGTVSGVYTNEGCTIGASDGATGWVYAKVNSVLFMKESAINNTIRFRASDMVNTSETSNIAVIRVDQTEPGTGIYFQKYAPTLWVKNQTPTVICRFDENASGININSVEYAFSIIGDTAPVNWAPVDGVYTNAACTSLASNGTTGIFYARVLAVPFNSDSASLNTIRFRARDMAGNLGTRTTSSVIQIDATPPGSFQILAPTTWIANQTPTVICQFSEITRGIDISSVEYAYSTTGGIPTNWAPVDGVYTDLACTNPAVPSAIGTFYARVLKVPFDQDAAVANTIRFRANDSIDNMGEPGIAFIIQIDTDIKAPIGLLASPSGSTTTNDFTLTWTNPADTSGIIGVWYKLDSPPTSNMNGTFVVGADIHTISHITVSGVGDHPIYVWLVDNTENVNFTKYSTTTLHLTTEGQGIPFPFPITLIVLGVLVAVFYFYKFKIYSAKKYLL